MTIKISKNRKDFTGEGEEWWVSEDAVLVDGYLVKGYVRAKFYDGNVQTAYFVSGNNEKTI